MRYGRILIRRSMQEEMLSRWMAVIGGSSEGIISTCSFISTTSSSPPPSTSTTCTFTSTSTSTTSTNSTNSSTIADTLFYQSSKNTTYPATASQIHSVAPHHALESSVNLTEPANQPNNTIKAKEKRKGSNQKKPKERKNENATHKTRTLPPHQPSRAGVSAA